MTSRSRVRASLLALGLAATVVGISGCGITSMNELKDRLFGGTATVTLEIKSIKIRSDRPSGADPYGPASVGTNAQIRFTAIGTFSVNGTATTETNDVSGGVVWTSSDAAWLLPGADGRVITPGSAGVATITATTPGIGSIPPLTSNSITVTVQ